jgi:hypothetical protein
MSSPLYKEEITYIKKFMLVLKEKPNAGMSATSPDF